ncbi:MAG: hydrogenase iron-sulfur subunit [Candidatus Lokiarchaeota archaeon]|nr:hydrogenase iron-sulfur subunit [Candidatus Lokiarchaeota archaeon]
MGIEPERVQMFHCSAAEGQRFQQEVTRISEEIEKLGSSPLKESKEKEEMDSNTGKKKKTE